MYQFFVEPEQVNGQRIRIIGADVNHIGNVLRMKQGERIRISVSDGRSYFARLQSIQPKEVLADIEAEDTEKTELCSRITLFQGLPKNDKMELIIQKAVELGVYEIVPVAMKRCVVQLDEKKAAGRQKRWQAIAESAAKQSKRTIIPNVQLPVSWTDALALADRMDVVLAPYEHARGMAQTRAVLQGLAQGQKIGIFIGPEGGFSPEEIQAFPENSRISLGRRILRTETAGLAVLAMLGYELEP